MTEFAVLTLAFVLFIAAAVASIGILATVAAVLARLFGEPIRRWEEWLYDSFHGGGR